MIEEKQNILDELSDSNHYVTRIEFDHLLKEVSDLTVSLNRLANTLDMHFVKLLDSVSGQTPERCVPISTHKAIVKGLVAAFTVIVLAAVGASQVIPVIFKG